MTEPNQIAGQPQLALDSLAGDAASADSLARLRAAVARKSGGGSTQPAKAQARQRKALLMLKAALQALGRNDFTEASATALKVLELDERSGLAWHVLAISLEKQGDVGQAFTAYEAAVALAPPDDVAVAHDLGRLAHRLGHLEIAEKLLARYLSRNPGDEEATNNLACVLRDQNRYGEAIDLLRGIIEAFPDRPVLWNALGTVLSESGDMGGSMVFFDEALRLDPGFYKARYNRANAMMNLGQARTAITDMDQALVGLTDRTEIATILMAKALTQLLVGDLEAGFETYEVRFDPALDGAVQFDVFGTRWTPGDSLTGRTLLVYGEQGLGDEVLFGNVLEDTIGALGPDGRLILALENRLVPLFQRSFPTATVIPHKSLRHLGNFYRGIDLPEPHPDIDLWTPMGSLFRAFRKRVSDFPVKTGFLTPDPDRVAHWRGVLDESASGPHVGLLWKSLKMGGSRARNYSPFDMWRPVLESPGVRFVNLQYGDYDVELAQARAAGLAIWTPPGIDLKNDLDDLAALCHALDGVTGPSTATTNLAASVGTPVWLTTGPGAWPCFGTSGFPCYPSMRLFHAERFGEWESVMTQMAEAMQSELAPRRAPERVAG